LSELLFSVVKHCPLVHLTYPRVTGGCTFIGTAAGGGGGGGGG